MPTDAGNFYLATPMERKEYLRIAVNLIPQEFMDLYGLHDKVKNGYVYCEIVRGMYGLPQAGILANKLLKERSPGFHGFTHFTVVYAFSIGVDIP